MHIDHIGIAVKDLDNAIKTYERLLNTGCYKQETIENEKVKTAFFETGESKVELLAATDSRSVIAAFIEKKGEGIHHIAFEVDDIIAEMERLQSEGFTILSEKPVKGADDKWIVFVHPKENHGVLVELCQSMNK